MRKFSKKIAMMMVLAMLVSMFSGIVSASAASVWSAKSVDDDNYAVVMGETIKVKKGEFINFDLFKGDEEATEAGYKYTWESSDADVLFINGAQGAKNGYARVKGEVGEKATISVSFTNLKTGVTVKTPRTFDVVVVEELEAEVEVEEADYTIETKVGEVELGEEVLYLDTAYTFTSKVYDADEKEVEKAEVKFFIDEKEIKFPYNFAGAGEYVITAVATIDKEDYSYDYAVYVVNNNVFEVEQTSMNSFKMTFEEAKDVTKVTRDTLTVYKASKEGATKVKTAVGSVTPLKDENAVAVTLYSNFAKDNVLFVEYAKEADNFTAIKGDVARIELNDTKVMAGNSLTKLPVKIYDQFGIDITSDELLGRVTIKKISGDYGIDIEGVKIRIWNDKKSAVVKAIYHTYTYTNGVEKTFESNEAVVTSVTTTDTYAPISAWAITQKTNDWEIAWNNDNRLALGDSGFRLIGKLVKTSTDTGVKNTPVNTYAEKVNGKQVFSFSSSDSAVVIVLSDGELIPVAKGTADIIVMKGDETVGVFTIEVVDARKATSMSVNVKGNTVISALDSVKVELDVRDQYGVKMDVAVKANDVANKNNAVEIKDLKTDNNISNSAAIGYGDKNEVIFKGSVQAASAETATYYRSIKIGDAVGYFEFTVKKVEGGSVSYRFDQASIEANTSVADTSWATFDNVFAPKKLTIQGYDKNGMLNMIGTPGEMATVITAEEAAKTVTGSSIEGKFFVTVAKPVWYAGNYSIVTDSNGNVSLKYMTADADNKISKATAGNYVFTLYRGVKVADGEYRYDYCSSSTITVKDAQAGYNVTVRSDKTSQKAADVKSATGSALQNAIKDVFKIEYSNKEIDYSKLYVGDMSKLNTEYVVGNDTVVVIKKIDINTVVTYKGVSYTLKETINLPITSVTCK